MTLEEQQAYTIAKANHDAGLRKKELDEAIAKANENNASKADIEAIVAKQEALQKALSEEILRIKAISERPEAPANGFKTLREAIGHALKSVQGEIDKAVAGKQDSAIKVAITMGEENTIGAGPTQYLLTENTGIISTIRKRELRYMANVSVGRIGNSRALWVEELDEQGTPIFIGEGDTKTQLSVRYEERTATVKKIAVYGKVTTEMMADLPQLISYIETNLMKRMDIVIEDQLFNGNNLGDNLDGSFNHATAFTGGGLANQIDSPNDYDVVMAVALQTELAFGIPNGIFVNPSVVARMKLTKDLNGQYLMPVFATANGLEVAEMRVIPTTAVTGENFLGGDLTAIQVRIREELGIQIGLNGNDFIENKKTMLIEKRLVQWVSANDEPVLIKGAFNTAKAILQTT